MHLVIPSPSSQLMDIPNSSWNLSILEKPPFESIPVERTTHRTFHVSIIKVADSKMLCSRGHEGFSKLQRPIMVEVPSKSYSS
jgi:hypothetical protein